jgi:TonB-linked SusC/RagA family outer membrane protein
VSINSNNYTMKTKFNGILTLLLALVVQISFAQEKTISGTVTDSSGALPGVSVLIKGTTTGTETDFDGKYSIKAKNGTVISYSYLGYTTVEKTVGSSNTINVTLTVDDNILDEVVIVGYGTTTKQTYTGTAKVVKAAELEKKSVSNISQALAGEVAGVNVMNPSGQPGTVATVRIRGFGSVNGNQDPLYVVDGVPFSGSLNSINPSDVATTTVLKDATATAIYGSRGANGVILLTTKTGKSGTSTLEVDVKTGVNFRSISDYEVITSPDEYLGLAWQAMANSNPATPGVRDATYANANLFGAGGIDINYNYYTNNDVSQLINPTTGKVVAGLTRRYTPENWRDYAFQSSIRTEANLKMSGGNDKTKYFSSFGYLDDIGYINNSSFKRYSTRLNISHKPKEWLTAQANISYTFNKTLDNGQGSSSNSVFWFVNNLPSIYPLFDRDASGNYIPDNRYGGNQFDYGGKGRSFGFGTNAIADAKYNLSETLAHSFNSNFSLKMDLFTGLTFETKYSAQYRTTTGNEIDNPFYGAASTNNGSLTQNRTSSLTQNMLNMFQYSKEFGNHNISALVAHESNQNIYRNGSISKKDVVNLVNGLRSPDNYINTMVPASGTKLEDALESIIGQVNYGYQNKYFFTASLRRDGSSRFVNEKWGTFGSAGFSWVASKESFMENVDFVNFLKLKVSYGLMGDKAGASRYSGQNAYDIINLGGDIALSVGAIQNPDLTWETSKMFQVGTEFTVLDNKISGAVDYYIKNTTDLFFDRRIGPSIGDAIIDVNDGELKNSGIEFDFTGHIIANKNFKLDLSINGEMLKNELTLMPIEPSTGEPKLIDQAGAYGRSKGHSLYDYYMREWAGVDASTGMATWNQYYHDANSNGVVDTGEGITNMVEYQDANPGNAISKTTTTVYANATEKYTGHSPIPDIRGAFNLKAKIYGFDISTQFAYSLGGHAYDSRYAGLLSNSQAGSAQFHVDARNAWQTPGDITNVPALQSNINTRVNSQSTRFITSTDYLALNNIKIGYSIPEKSLQKTGLSSVNLWLSGDNLFLLTKRKGYDPRNTQTGSTSVYRYAPLTTLAIGLRVKF